MTICMITQKPGIPSKDASSIVFTSSPVFNLRPKGRCAIAQTEFPENAILLTTLETNRGEGYRDISMAPLPIDRYRQLLQLDYPRKVLTIEPVMDFDLDISSSWIVELVPEYIWRGYNSRSKQVHIFPFKVIQALKGNSFLFLSAEPGENALINKYLIGAYAFHCCIAEGGRE